MSLPAKEFELLEVAIDRLSTTITRLNVLRVVVMAVLVFTFAKAFKQIDQNKIEQINELWAVTKTNARDLNIDRFRDFFLLNSLLRDATDFPVSPGTLDLNQTSWGRAREVLIQHKETKEALDKHENQIEIIAMINQPDEAESYTDIKLRLPSEIVEPAKKLQRELASGVQQNFRDAFTAELSLIGTKIAVDLRNWLAFFPFLFIVSQIYLLIHRKKRSLLIAILSKRVKDSERAAPESVPTVYRLLTNKGTSEGSVFATQPSQFLSRLLAVCFGGLLVYLVIAASPFLEGLSFAENFFNLTLPIGVVLLLSAFYSWVIYLPVSRQLEAQVLEAEGIESKTHWTILAREKVQFALSRIFKRVPRFWLTSGAALVLITLFMATFVDGCGGPKSGYEFVVRPAVIEAGLKADGSYVFEDSEEGAYWFPARWSLARLHEPMQRVVWWATLNQLLAWITYVISLLLAAISLLLVAASFRLPNLLYNRVANKLLMLTCGVVSLFIMSDICFYFVSSRLKFALLTVYCVVPLLLYILFGFSSRKRETWLRVKRVVMNLWLPVAACAVIVLLSFSLVLAFTAKELLMLERGFGVTNLHVVFVIFMRNFAAGVATLLLGVNFIWLGLRQLNK